MSWNARLVAMVVSVAALVAPVAAFGEASIDFTAKVRVLAAGERMQYHGKVSSDFEACAVDRKVRISNDGNLIGQRVTDEDGKFSINAPAVEDNSKVKFKLKPVGEECPAKTVYVKI